MNRKDIKTISAAAEEACDPCVVEQVEFDPTDLDDEEDGEETFWEAIDMLETAEKLIRTMLKRLPPARRPASAENFADDIGQFVNQFLE